MNIIDVQRLKETSLATTPGHQKDLAASENKNLPPYLRTLYRAHLGQSHKVLAVIVPPAASSTHPNAEE